jgi:hypothetical protein
MHAERADHQSQQLGWHDGFAECAFTERQISAGTPLPLIRTAVIEHDRTGQMTCSQFTLQADPCTRRSGFRLKVRSHARKRSIGTGDRYHLDLELGQGGCLETIVCRAIIDPEDAF